MSDIVRKVKRIAQDMTREGDIQPDNKRIAKDLGISEENVTRAFQIAAHPISLETPIGDDGN